jgi:hypothetical protein
MMWATGRARSPLLVTCSLWRSARDLARYAYGPDDPAHHDAIAADKDKHPLVNDWMTISA